MGICHFVRYCFLRNKTTMRRTHGTWNVEVAGGVGDFRWNPNAKHGQFADSMCFFETEHWQSCRTPRDSLQHRLCEVESASATGEIQYSTKMKELYKIVRILVNFVTCSTTHQSLEKVWGFWRLTVCKCHAVFQLVSIWRQWFHDSWLHRPPTSLKD